ncbi:MAG: NAD(P)-dependent alcohol dehydrogenase [Acidimicrobiia bacterium]|nr:NAD(P)-dependent alcohol dehydrogenase [Acidimicrobiia bacterium]
MTDARPDPDRAGTVDLPDTMRATIRREYGGPERLRLESVPLPEVTEGRVLIEVASASVNQLDWHLLTGLPYLLRPSEGVRRPRRTVMGADVSGTVVAVGDGVDTLAIGDRVFGDTRGAFAEYALARPEALAKIPDGVSFVDAAAIPVGGLTALQGLRDKGGVQPGDRVLVNGASGSVGTFAVQIARILGAEVTAVCSARNRASALASGASKVIDYHEQDFTNGPDRYDVVVDIAGKTPLSRIRRVLDDGGRIVAVGGPKGNWLGPIPRMIGAKVVDLVAKTKFEFFVAKANTEDLEELARYVVAGDMVPVIERTLPLDDIVRAITDQGAGHAQGKTIIVP